MRSDGSVHRFNQFTTGKITLLSFMYTYCVDPAGCPMVYRTLTELRRRAIDTPGMARHLRLVSLSFDPTHDTAETMARYASGLDGSTNPIRWEFLTTSSIAQLQPLLDGLGQNAQLDRDQAGIPTRFYSHMVKLFLIDKRGRVREIYSTAFLQPDLLMNDVQTLIMEDAG